MKKITDSLEPTQEQQRYFESDPAPLTETRSARVNFNQEFVYQNMLEITKQYKLFNLNYDNVFYGKIDNNNNFIVPKASYIEEVENLTEQHFLLSFVRDAFENFTREWDRLQRRGTLNPDTPIDINPKKTYEHYQTAYNNIMNKHYENFVNFVETSNSQKEITDLKSFLHVFSQYVNTVTPDNPVLLTKFVSSKYCSQHVSGLFIDTLNNSSNDYNKKISEYLNNPNFPAYVELAILNGFIVDKNLPWRLVANLESEFMKKYIENYTDPKNCYSFFFQGTNSLDLILIKKHILKFYNNFINQYPTVTLKTTKICNQKIKINQNQIKRQQITEFDINQILLTTTKEWWRLYAYISISESNIDLKQTEFDKIVNLSFEYKEKFDINKGMAYVAQQIKMRQPTKRKAASYTY